MTDSLSDESYAEDVRERVMVLSSSFHAELLDWFMQLGGQQVNEAMARRILNSAMGELQRLQTALASGDINAPSAAMGKQHVRDLLEGVLRQEMVSGEFKAQIRHFIIEYFPETFLPSGEYRYTQDWFYFHEANWKAHFGSFAGVDGLRFLEVGSFEGRSACWMADHLLTGEGCVLLCVDTFDAYQDQERNFDHNIRARESTYKKIVRLRGRSQQILPFLPDNEFDFIYVDGSHLGLDALSDAVAAWRLAKQGGIIVFDDYENAVFPGTFGLSVKPAIDAFMTMMNGRYDLIFKNWQVALLKRT